MRQRRYKVVLVGVEEEPNAKKTKKRRRLPGARAFSLFWSLSWKLRLSFVLFVVALALIITRFGG